jgi:hypothetical protein
MSYGHSMLKRKAVKPEYWDQFLMFAPPEDQEAYYKIHLERNLQPIPDIYQEVIPIILSYAHCAIEIGTLVDCWVQTQSNWAVGRITGLPGSEPNGNYLVHPIGWGYHADGKYSVRETIYLASVFTNSVPKASPGEINTKNSELLSRYQDVIIMEDLVQLGYTTHQINAVLKNFLFDSPMGVDSILASAINTMVHWKLSNRERLSPEAKAMMIEIEKLKN